MRRAAPVIGVWGHYADANLGDDACPTALMNHLGKRFPRARFVLFCRFPRVAHSIWGLPAYPVRPFHAGEDAPRTATTAASASPPPRWRARVRAIPLLRPAVRAARAVWSLLRAIPAELRFAWQAYERLRGVDVLMIAGSNPLFDFFGGFWGYPYRVWQWTTLARWAGVRVAFVSVGAGPIVSARSGRLLVRALRRAAYVSFRDACSQRLMQEYGFAGVGYVCPDLAHSVTFAIPAARRSEQLRVGINPMIVHHRTLWPVADPQLQARYITSLATLAHSLIAAGHDVFLYGTQIGDELTAREVQAAIHAAAPSLAMPTFVMPASITHLLELCASADALVTTRYHGAIFAMRTARPTIAICYQPKTREVLETAGQGSYAIDFEDVTPDALVGAFDCLRANRDRVESTLRRNARDLGAQLDRQYDHIARLLGRRAARGTSVHAASPDIAGTLS